MQRALIVVVAIVAAGWVQASAAQPNPSRSSGEGWLPVGPSAEPSSADESTAHPAKAKRSTGLAAATATRWPSATEAPRFGSGLEDDAPVRAPNVFLLSGLEGMACMSANPPRTLALRIGSGLEEGAPIRPPNVFLQSGLEETAEIRTAYRSRAARFGSGLEDGEPHRARNVFYESGL